MDLVYIVREGDDNIELLYSLRSIDKFAKDYENVWIVGYKPNWINDSVKYLPFKSGGCTWERARNNLIAACNCPDISNDFILMNDDFILTRPLQSWGESLSKVQNTLRKQIAEWAELKLKSRYALAFVQLKNFLKTPAAYSYELHIPMIINKRKFLDMLENKHIKQFVEGKSVYLYRSLYGNIYKVKFNSIIRDVKLYGCDFKGDTEWLSVFNGYIGVKPKLTNFLKTTFPNKCRFEKRAINGLGLHGKKWK